MQLHINQKPHLTRPLKWATYLSYIISIINNSVQCVYKWVSASDVYLNILFILNKKCYKHCYWTKLTPVTMCMFTEAAVFSCGLCFPWAFPFISLILVRIKFVFSCYLHWFITENCTRTFFQVLIQNCLKNYVKQCLPICRFVWYINKHKVIWRISVNLNGGVENNSSSLWTSQAGTWFLTLVS